jgi:hypothetical protein
MMLIEELFRHQNLVCPRLEPFSQLKLVFYIKFNKIELTITKNVDKASKAAATPGGN